MPQRLVGADCWIFLKRLQDKTGEYRTYLFCQTKQRGLSCPRDIKGGKKAYELCGSCFENIGTEEFLNDVVYPSIMEVRTPQVDPTIGDIITQQNNEVEAQKKRAKESQASRTHVN